MAAVTLRGVEKSYGTSKVIHGVDIDIGDEEFFVLVGPSGCGKSTLLRMIAGLEDISAGQISIGGRVVNEVTPRDRDVAMVFQNYALYPHKTVAENMGFGLKLRKAEKAVINERVARAAGILGLTDLLARYPRQLSGGQRQRVAMGRAIVRDPQVFLFDEPLSNLDAKLRVQMRTEIRSLHQSLRTTSVYVTHDQVEAMTMADRIVVLSEGRVAQIGTPLELYDRPANLLVAGFIGSPAMNMFKGTLRHSGAAAWVETGGGFRLPLRPDAPILEGREVIYGVRPEHLSLAGPSDGLPTPIHVVEQTGLDMLAFGKLADTSVCCLLRGRPDVAPGQQVHLRPELGNVHLFDAVNGERLSAPKAP